MESIENLIKGIRTEIQSRFSNQFIASFYIAFSIINWEIYLAIFSGDLKTLEKISIILSKLHPSKLLWYPLALSSAYMIIAPTTAVISNILWGFARQKINNIHRHFDQRAYLSIDKSLKLKTEMYEYDKKYIEIFKETTDVRKEYQKEIADREVAISEIKSKLVTKESEYSALELERDSLLQQVKDLKPKSSESNRKLIDESLESILQFLSDTEAEIYVSTLSRHLKITEQKTQYHLDKLKEMKFVQEAVGRFSLSSLGRKYYFENLENKKSK